MILAHKIRLNPTPEQEEYFYKASHNSRFVYNWGLATWKAWYDAGEKFSYLDLRKHFNAIKREDFPWVMETCKSVGDYALKDLNSAFQNFFKRPNVEYPKFKSRHKSKLSFAIQNSSFTTDGNWLKIGKVKTWINMTEQIRFDGKVMSARFSYSSGYWWVSFGVEVPFSYVPNNGPFVGVDLGIKTLIVTSDGEIFENQKILKRYERKLRKMNKSLSRKTKGSERYNKAKVKLTKLHYKISCLRSNYIHSVTTYLTKNYGFIGIEDLNVSGMVKNRRLAKAISDASFGEIVRQLDYKAELHGSQVQQVGRFFPSSKLCSYCGYKNTDLTLSDRTWQCPDCGAHLDRDLNASTNILNEAIRLASE